MANDELCFQLNSRPSPSILSEPKPTLT